MAVNLREIGISIAPEEQAATLSELHDSWLTQKREYLKRMTSVVVPKDDEGNTVREYLTNDARVRKRSIEKALDGAQVASFALATEIVNDFSQAHESWKDTVALAQRVIDEGLDASVADHSKLARHAAQLQPELIGIPQEHVVFNWRDVAELRQNT